MTALPGWIDFMKVAHDHKPPSEFPRPGGLVTVKIDVRTGKLPAEGDDAVVEEVFLAGTEPTEIGQAPEPSTSSDAGSADGARMDRLP